MTEAEWLACDGPTGLLKSVGDRITERKARLFACACCRRIWKHLSDNNRQDLDTIERVAEGEIDRTALPRWCPTSSDTPGLYAVDCAAAKTVADLEVLDELIYWACESAAGVTAASNKSDDDELEGDPYLRNWELTQQARLVRDLFPFRPVIFAPEWRTDTATAIARQMYESRDFGAMPILADALQDAGCDSDDILAHCRAPQATHVRGCWVVDLVLGKS